MQLTVDQLHRIAADAALNVFVKDAAIRELEGTMGALQAENAALRAKSAAQAARLRELDPDGEYDAEPSAIDRLFPPAGDPPPTAQQGHTDASDLFESSITAADRARKAAAARG